MQLFCADATIFSNFFCPQNVEKTLPKNCSEKLKSTFFPYCPELPKRPKQKNSCSKMWLIDQLYIELGPPLLVYIVIERPLVRCPAVLLHHSQCP